MRPISREAKLVLGAVVEALQSSSVHINVPIVCDHCEDPDKEAFPYCVGDSTGKFWQHLCNDCFDALGCQYQEVTP